MRDRTAISTFDRVAIDLAHQAFADLAVALRQRIGRILERWRNLSLKAMPHLNALTLEEFEDNIAEILWAAADALQSAEPEQLRGVIESGPMHGVDRFMQHYSLLDLFEEVRILRGVVVLELAHQMERPLGVAEAATFHAIFDIIIQQGVTALIEKQGDNGRDAQFTLRGMNEQLMVGMVRQNELLEYANRAEEAWRESEERYRTLFELGPVAIYSIEASGVIRAFNHQAAKLWGRSPAVGDTDQRFCGSFRMFRPDGTVLPHDQCPMAEVASGKVLEVHDAEIIIERPDGSRVTVVVNIRPLKNSRGEVTGAVSAFFDISDRVAMENQIKRQAEALSGESRRKDEFLAMLSHELRNPLAPIRSALHVLRLQERPGSENAIQQRAREVIERQVSNLTKLVSDLLEVSRVVSSRIRLERQTVDLNQVIQHAAETAAAMIEQRKHTLVVHLSPAPVWCDVDATRIEEVFVNLLNNAAKYTPDGGRIEVRCETPGESDYVLVRVRDSGMGIDRDLLPRIFDLFTQADRSLAHSAGGLGIGLSLAHRLIELHGGAIEAHSPPLGGGPGSEFIVRLALTSAPRRPVAPAPVGEKTARPEGLRVLVVDDNIDSASMLASLLRHSGYSVQSAYTGPEGLKVALQWRPDFVLLDIGLPGLDGYEVARRLRSGAGLGSSGKLIALTGYGRDTDIARARDAGFDAHMVKPIDFDELEKLMATPQGPSA